MPRIQTDKVKARVVLDVEYDPKATNPAGIEELVVSYLGTLVDRGLAGGPLSVELIRNAQRNKKGQG